MCRSITSVFLVSIFLLACTKNNPTAPQSQSNAPHLTIVNRTPWSVVFYTNDYYDRDSSIENSHSGTIPISDSVTFVYSILPNQTLISYTMQVLNSDHRLIGEQISSQESIYPATTGVSRYEINVPVQYFSLYINNNSSSYIDQIKVNNGSLLETTVSVLIPNNTLRYPAGYYHSHTNSSVQLRFVPSSSSAATMYRTIYFSLPMTTNQSVTINTP